MGGVPSNDHSAGGIARCASILRYAANADAMWLHQEIITKNVVLSMRKIANNDIVE